jgi:hypothetical protein
MLERSICLSGAAARQNSLPILRRNACVVLDPHRPPEAAALAVREFRRLRKLRRLPHTTPSRTIYSDISFRFLKLLRQTR